MKKNLFGKIEEFIQKHWKLILLVLIGVGAALRIVEIFRTEFWYDEAFTGIVVRQDWNQMFATIAADKVHPPVYYTLLKLWSLIFGSGVEGLRSFSMIWGVGLIPLAFYFLKSQFTKNGVAYGLLAAFFLAVSPFFVGYSVEARVYSMLAFFGLATIWLFIKWINSGFKIISFTLLALLVMNGFCLTLHFVAYVIILVEVFLFIILRFKKLGDFILKYWYVFALLFIIAVSVIAPSIKDWIQEQFKDYNLGWIPAASVSNISTSATGFLTGVNRSQLGVPDIYHLNLFGSPILLGMLALVTCLLSGYKLYIEKKSELLSKYLVIVSFMILPQLVFIVASGFDVNFYLERYLIISGVMFIIALSIAIPILINHKSIFVVILFAALLFFVQIPDNHLNNGKIVNIVNQITNQTIYMDSPIDFIVTKYYANTSTDKIKIVTNGSNYEGWAMISRNEEVVSADKMQKNDVLITEDVSKYDITKFSIREEFGRKLLSKQ